MLGLMKQTAGLPLALVLTGVLWVSASAPALGGTATAPSPTRVYQRLLTTSIPDSALPSGFYSSSVGIYKPSSQAQKHHAVGGVEIDLNGGDAALIYLVFATRADAVADWNDANLRSHAKSTLVPPAGFPGPGLIANMSIKGKNAFGKNVTNGVTDLAFVSKFVIVQAVTRSTDNTDSGDIPAAITLGRFGLARLNAAAKR